MAIDFADTSAKFGHIIAALNEVNTWRGTTLQNRVDTIVSDFASADTDLITEIFTTRDSTETSFSSWVSYLAGRAQAVLIRAVENDRPLVNITLTSALEEYVRQMKVAAESYNQSLVTLTGPTAVGAPTSNTQWVTTDKDGSGVKQDLVVPDVYLIRIIADQDTGGSRYAETVSVVGKPSDSAPTDYEYPTGSGINTNFTILDPSQAIGVVTDPSFDSFTTLDTPDNWEIRLGAASTNVFEVSDDARDGADGTAIHLKTSGGVLTVAVRQQVSLSPNTVYAVHFKYKPVANGSAAAATVIPKIRLTDEAGTTINDDAAGVNQVAGSAHSVVLPGSGWNHGYSGVFITPKNFPGDSESYLEISLEGDAADAEGYFDHVNMVEITPLYSGGPYLTGFSGTVEAVKDDTWTLTITLTSGTISSYIIRGLDRLLNLKTLGIRVPTSATPTRADALIV